MQRACGAYLACVEALKAHVPGDFLKAELQTVQKSPLCF